MGQQTNSSISINEIVWMKWRVVLPSSLSFVLFGWPPHCRSPLHSFIFNEWFRVCWLWAQRAKPAGKQHIHNSFIKENNWIKRNKESWRVDWRREIVWFLLASNSITNHRGTSINLLIDGERARERNSINLSIQSTKIKDNFYFYLISFKIVEWNWIKIYYNSKVAYYIQLQWNQKLILLGWMEEATQLQSTNQLFFPFFSLRMRRMKKSGWLLLCCPAR